MSYSNPGSETVIVQLSRSNQHQAPTYRADFLLARAVYEIARTRGFAPDLFLAAAIDVAGTPWRHAVTYHYDFPMSWCCFARDWNADISWLLREICDFHESIQIIDDELLTEEIYHDSRRKLAVCIRTLYDCADDSSNSMRVCLGLVVGVCSNTTRSIVQGTQAQQAEEAQEEEEGRRRLALGSVVGARSGYEATPPRNLWLSLGRVQHEMPNEYESHAEQKIQSSPQPSAWEHDYYYHSDNQYRESFGCRDSSRRE